MNWNDLEREKKYFLLIGIPCFIFVVLVFISYYVLFISFYLTILVILLAGLFRKQKKWGSLSKISILMVMIFFVQLYNITHIPSQFVRHSPGGRQDLLDPEHEDILQLRSDFYSWHLYKYGVSFDDMSEENQEGLEIKLKRVDYYIRTQVVEYTSDTEAPYHAFDHVASLDEIFASDTDGDGLLQDDCDGITVLTVSLLLKMGYNAYVSECLSHWNTIVFPEGSDPKTLEGFNDGIHLYNSWGRPSYYIFNEEEVFFPPGRPITTSLFELFFDGSTFESEYLGYFEGDYLQAPFLVLLLLAAALLFIASLLIYHIVRIGMPEAPSIKEEKMKWFFSKKMIHVALKVSSFGSLIAFILYWFAISGLGFLGSLVLSCALIIILRYTEYQIKLN